MASRTMKSADAYNYIINPLHAPDPSEETGLNSSFRSTFAAPTQSQESLVRQQQILDQQKRQQEMERKQQQRSAMEREKAMRSPEKSSPLAREPATNGVEPMSPPKMGNRKRSTSNVGPQSNSPLKNMNGGPLPRRGQSLNHHGPRTPNRHSSVRSKRSSYHPIDPIDSLDFGPGGPYHHEGPFDATLMSRNLYAPTSPVAAVAESNALALKATPRENVMDAVMGHRPLDGVASVPPGVQDQWGRTYSYEEKNVMEDESSGGGQYGRYEWIGGRNLDEAQKAYLADDHPWKIRTDYPADAVAQQTSNPPSKSNSTRRGRISIGALGEDEDAIELVDESKKRNKAVNIQEHELEGEEAGASSSLDGGLARNHSLRDSLRRKIGSLRKRKE